MFVSMENSNNDNFEGGETSSAPESGPHLNPVSSTGVHPGDILSSLGAINDVGDMNSAPVTTDGVTFYDTEELLYNSEIKRDRQRRYTLKHIKKRHKDKKLLVFREDNPDSGATQDDTGATQDCSRISQQDVSDHSEKEFQLKEQSEEEFNEVSKDNVCSVCLDLFYEPHSVVPCGHIFCSPCLRRLGRKNFKSCICPLCRTGIVSCQPVKEKSREIRKNHPDIYIKRKHFENSTSVKKLPLPQGIRWWEAMDCYGSRSGLVIGCFTLAWLIIAVMVFQPFLLPYTPAVMILALTLLIPFFRQLEDQHDGLNILALSFKMCFLGLLLTFGILFTIVYTAFLISYVRMILCVYYHMYCFIVQSLLGYSDQPLYECLQNCLDTLFL